MRLAWLFEWMLPVFLDSLFCCRFVPLPLTLDSPLVKRESKRWKDSRKPSLSFHSLRFLAPAVWGAGFERWVPQPNCATLAQGMERWL